MARELGFAAAVTLWCFLQGVAAQYDSCTTGAVANIGNGQCDAALNVPSCGYDGGDVSIYRSVCPPGWCVPWYSLPMSETMNGMVCLLRRLPQPN